MKISKGKAHKLFDNGELMSNNQNVRSFRSEKRAFSYFREGEDMFFSYLK